MGLCECANWARSGHKVITEHHSSCPKYDPEGDSKRIIEALLKGKEAWAQDEDGVHPECWEAYRNAKLLVGQKLTHESA
jgi:hypothetical protein